MGAPLILVADDNPDVRHFIERSVLVPAGYRVRAVADSDLALSLSVELEPDLIIADNQAGGLEFTRRVTAKIPHPPVILMTDDPASSHAVEAMRAGAFDYLVKPFDAELLISAVGRGLAQGRRWQEIVASRREAESKAALMQGRLAELDALTNLGRTVTALLDHDQVLTTVVDSAVELTGAEEGSLLLVDETTGELYMRAQKNFDEEFAQTFRLPAEDSLAGQVLESGRPVLLDEDSPKKIKTAYLVHSLIYVPLTVRGQTLGVLGVDNRNEGRTFTAEDVAIMESMAGYAAIAIDNARLITDSESERRRLESILASVENGVLVVDPNHRLLIMNHTAREAFHVGEDWSGHKVNEALDHPRLLSVLQPGGSAQVEIELDDGRVFECQSTPIRGVGMAIMMQDITHLKELDRIKSEFVTTVSHDLRSPLTTILGYMELIERSGPLNGQQEEFFHRVQMSVSQINALVNNLLDLGRIEEGLDEAKEQTPLSVLARYALEGMRSTAESKNLTIAAILPEDLPMVNGAPIRLRQMIGNLLENAIKYTPDGGKIRVEAHAEAEQVVLCIRDSGPGIPARDQPHLFEKFYRASNIPSDLPGTGLGLSIVKSIVENHNGRIWVDSAPGSGAAFTVVLPAAEA